jgi:hypothetical protein
MLKFETVSGGNVKGSATFGIIKQTQWIKVSPDGKYIYVAGKW